MPFRPLRILLTEGEIAQKGAALATLVGEYTRISDEKSAAVKGFKAVLDEMNERIKALARAIRDRTEERHVEVVETRDEQRLIISTVRTDTGEVISTRAMTAAERQVNLPIPPPAPQAEQQRSPARAPAPAAEPASETLAGISAEQQAAIDRAFAPAPAPPPRLVPSAPRLAAEEELDAAERRFQLLEIDPEPDEPEEPPAVDDLFDTSDAPVSEDDAEDEPMEVRGEDYDPGEVGDTADKDAMAAAATGRRAPPRSRRSRKNASN